MPRARPPARIARGYVRACGRFLALACSLVFWPTALRAAPRTSRTTTATSPSATADTTADATADATAKPPRPDAPLDDTMVQVRLLGAVAVATVEGPLPLADGAKGAHAAEVHFDIVPPVGAVLWDVAFRQRDAWKTVPPVGPNRPGNQDSTSAAEQAYDEALRAMQLERAAAADVDDDLRFRVRLASSAREGRPTRVRYRLVIPISGGEQEEFRLAFPAAPESVGAAARLRVEAPAGSDITEIALGPEKRRFRGDGPRLLESHVDLRGAWEISFTSHHAEPSSSLSPLAGLVTVAPGRNARLAYSVRAALQPPAAFQGTVLFVLDRSRSVGIGGLAIERDMLHEVLDRLPRSTRFQVLFFDRTVKPLFVAPRTATGEALAALDQALLPDTLENGSELLAAAVVAGQVLRSQAAIAAEPTATWLVLLTDGALATRAASEADYLRAFGTLPAGLRGVAALAVRARADAAFPSTTEPALRAFAGGTGAPYVARELREDERREGIAKAMADLQAGGDLTRLSVALGGLTHAARAALAPGTSAHGSLNVPTIPASGTARAVFSWQRGNRHEERAVRVQRAETGALAALTSLPSVRAWASPWLAALVEPLIAPPPPEANAPLPGTLERSVVRDHLSLRFLPRARACYQRRTGPTAALRDLEGRVRLALDLARGELTGVDVLGNSLGRGDDGSPAISTPAEQKEVDKIVACLREAAFSLDVPPTYMNDEGVRAVLNLHFHPYRQSKPNGLDSEVSHELDMLLETAPDHVPANTLRTSSLPEQAPTPPPTALP